MSGSQHWNRWVSVFLLGVFGGTGGAILGDYIALELWPSVHRPEVGVPALIFVALVVKSLLSWNLSRWKALIGGRHWRRDPPLWISVILGTILACFVLVLWQCKTFDLDKVALTVIVQALLYTLMGALFLKAPRGALAPPGATAKTDSGQFDASKLSIALDKWILSDDPAQEDHDLFGHSSIASRILRRLVDQPGAAHAIVGPRGSGKTTILRIVQGRLYEPEFSCLRIVAIDLWPFETAKAAIEGIVRSILAMLGDEISVFRFRSLPSDYSALALGEASWVQQVAAMTGISRSQSPYDVLETIDVLLKRIGLHIVLAFRGFSGRARVRS